MPENDTPVKKSVKKESPDLEKYLWRNNYDQNKQFIYIYLNEKNEEIMGNTIGNSPKISPYSENSLYFKGSYCVGIAKYFINVIKPTNTKYVKNYTFDVLMTRTTEEYY